MFPVVGRIPDAMLNLVSPTNNMLDQYEASMDLTPTSVLRKKVTFKDT